MATLTFSALADGPSDRFPLVPHQIALMQPLLGTIGFIVGLVRPDGYFAYCVLCRLVTADRLTTGVVRAGGTVVVGAGGFCGSPSCMGSISQLEPGGSACAKITWSNGVWCNPAADARCA
jgi:hypothetical protein